MRAAEQGPKQESIQDWNIHYNIRLLWNSTCAKKRTNEWVLQVGYSLAAVGLRKKIWHTAMADCAVNWEVIVANRCVYRQNVCDEKRYLFLSWRYDWERCMCKMKSVSRRYLLHLARTSSGGSGGTIQRLRRSRGVTQPIRFRGSPRFREAAHGIRSRIRTMNLQPSLLNWRILSGLAFPPI